MTRFRLTHGKNSVIRRAFLTVAAFSFIAPIPTGHTFPDVYVPSESVECLVVLHGLLRTERNTARLAAQFDGDFDVLNFGYNSRKPIDEVAGELSDAVDAHCDGTKRSIHFTAHSMGGIIVRQYLEYSRPKNLGRVVLLGPPNGGSELVDRLPKRPMRWIAGESALSLGTGPDSTPNSMGAVDFELGVIAGTRSIKPIASRLIPGDDDGLVAVERTRVDGMRDHIAMPVHHQQLVKSPEVAAQVAYFIANGSFDHATPESEPHQATEQPSSK